MLAVFEGLTDPPGISVVSVILNQPAALECRVFAANPKPIVEWNHENGSLVSNFDNSKSGRYLIINSVTVGHLNTKYRCKVTNALINTVMVSNLLYQLVNNLSFSQIVTYKPLQDLVGSIGEQLSFIYIGGYRSPTKSLNNGVILRCRIPNSSPSVTFTVSGHRLSFTVPDPLVVGGRTEVRIECARLAVDIDTDGGKVTASLSVISKSKLFVVQDI